MPTALSPELSKKFRFFAFLSMVLLVYVHGYNLNNRYLLPFTIVEEPMTVTTWTEYFLANGLFRFRIPMLFAISGYLFAFYDNAPHKERIRNRVRTLLVPYFLWSIIGLGIAVLLAQWVWTSMAVQNAHLQPSDKPFGAYTFMDWLKAILWPTSYQLWFLRCLFMYNLLYPWIKAGLQKKAWILLTLFGLLWFTSFGVVLIEGEGLYFFSLGVWAYLKRKDIQQKPEWLSLPLFTFLFFFLCALKTVVAFKGLSFLSMFQTVTVLIILHKVVVVLGLLVAWYGLDKAVTVTMQKPWFVHVTGYAFIIYALHVPLITYLIDPAFQFIRHWPNYRMLTFLLLPLLIIGFCIVCGAVMRRWIPKAYAVLTGNRGL